MGKYEPVIGLEVHVELNTKTKMFCGCGADYFPKEKRRGATHFGPAKPNTHTCPICLGLPGALPYINKEAIKKCKMIGIALNCKVQEESLFERKNYFYPDLAKGFQTSQYRWPLCVDGLLEIEDKSREKKKIRINRVHQEEDTGKLMHLSEDTVIDFNRCGVPLVEIVTEPDFVDTEQVRNYGKLLQQILRDLGVSNADMEKGDMRLEANVSVREVGQKELPNYRVELKNINSFKFMVDAIEYEIKRQIEALENSEILAQETRGWNEDKKQTYLQRRKEEANDYRYFPEPDLPVLKDGGEAETIGKMMPRLSGQKAEELSREKNIPVISAASLVNKGLDEMFIKIVNWGEGKGIDPKGTANFLINKDLSALKLDLSDPAMVGAAILSQKSDVISDEVGLSKIIDEVLGENNSLVEDYKKGKQSVIQVFVGLVMRKTQGKAEGTKVLEILRKKLT